MIRDGCRSGLRKRIEQLRVDPGEHRICIQRFVPPRSSRASMLRVKVSAGSCTADYSQSCPLGWSEDVNHDCLAPSSYSGKCVGRKNFQSMKSSEKGLWAKTCSVAWLDALLLLNDLFVHAWLGSAFSFEALPQGCGKNQKS